MTESSRIQLDVSPRARYGRSSGTTRSGASFKSFCVPSSLELETSARVTPAFRKIAIASFGDRTSHASWL